MDCAIQMLMFHFNFHDPLLLPQIQQNQLALDRARAQVDQLERDNYAAGAIDVDARFIGDAPELQYESAPCAGAADLRMLSREELAERMGFGPQADARALADVPAPAACA